MESLSWSKLLVSLFQKLHTCDAQTICVKTSRTNYVRSVFHRKPGRNFWRTSLVHKLVAILKWGWWMQNQSHHFGRLYVASKNVGTICVLPSVRAKAGLVDPRLHFTTNNTSEALNNIIKQEMNWKERSYPCWSSTLSTFVIVTQLNLKRLQESHHGWLMGVAMVTI